MLKMSTFLFILTASFLFLLPSAFADELGNSRALQNLSSAKAYFDVTMGVPLKLETRLRLIHTTYQDIGRTGMKPDFIIGFRSKASNFVTKGDDYVFEEDIAVKKKIRDWVKRFKKMGIVMEQCAIAAEFQDIDPKDFLPEIEVVRNGYVSMIGYQAKGYSMVPMD